MTPKPTIDPWIEAAAKELLENAVGRLMGRSILHCTPDPFPIIIARHAAPVLAEKDRLIDFWRKAAGIEQDEAFEVDKEIAKLKDYSDRWPGNMMDEYQAMQEELAEARAEIERLQGLCSDYIEGRA